MLPRRAVTLPATVALTLGAALPAHAHLVSTGFGPFYDGLAHLFVTPENLLPVIALALLAGLRGPRCGRAVLFVLPLAWLAGSAAGMLVSAALALPVAAAACTVGLGALVAADGALPLPAVGCLAVMLGLLSGGLDGAELATAGSTFAGVAGSAAAVFVVVSLLAGQVVSLRALWARIAVRVAGSWIAAMGMLILGWSLR